MKMLVAIDGTGHSWKTLDKALTIGKALNAEITTLGIVGSKPLLIASIPTSIVDEYRDTIEKVAHEVMEKTKEHCLEKGVVVKTMVEHGPVADTICEVADKGNFDLLVIGNSGLGRIEEFILGSVSNKVAHTTKVDLLIVK